MRAMPKSDGGAERATEERGPRELDQQREQFHRELMRKSMRIAELELLIKHNQAVYQAVYESSVSWRVTRPIRALGKLLRGPR